MLEISVGWSLVAGQVGVTSLGDAAWMQPSKGSIWASDSFSGISGTLPYSSISNATKEKPTQKRKNKILSFQRR